MSDCQKRFLRLALLGVLLFFISGCLSPVRTLDRSLQSLARDPMQIARLNVFLVLKTPDDRPVRMEVARLEVLAGDTWLPLLKGARVFDSAAIGEGQFFVGAQNVPPGDYRRMRIKVTGAEIKGASGSYKDVQLEPSWFEINFTGGQSLDIDDSRTFFLSWDVGGSMDETNRFHPALHARSSTQQIFRDLTFVSCPEIDTIFVIRADNNRVVASFGLKGAPTYLAIDPVSANRRLFVLCSRERMIKIVDLETYRVVEFFPVPLTDNPSYMELSRDGSSLYLLDKKGGYLTRMDTDTGQIFARSFLDFRPSYLLSLEEQNLLAVSLALSRKVLLLEPLDLRVVGEISTGNYPEGLLGIDDQLYIAEREDNSVRVIDLATRREQSRLVTGLGPRRLISSGNQIYITNSLDRSISILEEGGFAALQKLRGFGQPGEMALNSFYRRLYVADEEKDALTVVDVNSNRVIDRIELGAMPLGLAVIQ